jgi:hypothetical protein
LLFEARWRSTGDTNANFYRLGVVMTNDEGPTAILACPECGAFLEETTDRLACAEKDRDLSENEVRKLRRRVAYLEAEFTGKPTAHPRYADAVEVLERWRDRCRPKARDIEGGHRLERVLARLGHYPKEELLLAVEGYAAFPWKGKSADAELIFRSAADVDRGLALAERLAAGDWTPLAKLVDERKLSVLGQAAMRYARAALAIFPVWPGKKTPACPHGLLDATTDLDRIARFWFTHPDFNLAIRCGLPSRLIVLDVDGEEGMESLRRLEAQIGPLPPTASVVTPRGGQHYYFRHPLTGPISNTTGYPDTGLDIRADGGYVLAPPSSNGNGRSYEVDDELPVAPLPTALHKMLLDRQDAERLGIRRDYAQMVRHGAKRGERDDDLLKLAGHLWTHGHEPEEVLQILLAVNEARCRPPLAPKQVEKIVRSVQRMRARQQQQLV